MKREFKYIRVRYSKKTEPAKIRKMLNKRGLQGWELFSQFNADKWHKSPWMMFHFRKLVK